MSHRGSKIKSYRAVTMPGQSAWKVFAAFFAFFALSLAGAPSAWAATECSDGIDNDGDQTIDALVEGGTDQSVQKFADRDAGYVYTVVENQLRANGLPSPRDQLGKDKNGMAFVNDAATAQKVCRILGYANVVFANSYSADGRTIWTNGGDSMYWWNGSVWQRKDDQCRYRNPNHWSWLTDITCQGKLPACQDGKDNDGDGKIDYPQDPGCVSATDTSEVTHDSDCTGPDDASERPATACNNGVDDDRDGLVDLNDPGCSSAIDTDERNPNGPQCDNGRDDDGDGKTDYRNDGLGDPDCSGPSDPTEAPEGACSNGIDDDRDGLIDMNDPGCSSPGDTDERNPNGPQCDNGRDDDGDGKTDYRNDGLGDPDCSGPSDPTEAPDQLTACNNGLDDDHDGYIDASDDGCRASGGTSECHSSLTQCDNCIDDDGDGRIDMADSDCTVPWGSSEGSGTPQPQCRDGIDNDGDKLTDYPNDPGCSSADDTWERNASGPQCDNGNDDDNDGKTDYPADPDCTGPTDPKEGADQVTPCSNGLDDDHDGYCDSNDDGCIASHGSSECHISLSQCDNCIDDDGDGRIDMADSDCTAPWGTSEAGSQPPCSGCGQSVCSNGLDDDQDGYIDGADKGCLASGGTSECHASLAQCDNCLDDDGDGLVDMADAGCFAPWDETEAGCVTTCLAPAYRDRQVDSSDYVLHLELSANVLFDSVSALADSLRKNAGAGTLAKRAERRAGKLRKQAIAAIGSAGAWPQSAAECAELQAHVGEYLSGIDGLYRTVRKLAAAGARAQGQVQAALQSRTRALQLARLVRTQGDCQ